MNFKAGTHTPLILIREIVFFMEYKRHFTEEELQGILITTYSSVSSLADIKN